MPLHWHQVSARKAVHLEGLGPIHFAEGCRSDVALYELNLTSRTLWICTHAMPPVLRHRAVLDERAYVVFFARKREAKTPRSKHLLGAKRVDTFRLCAQQKPGQPPDIENTSLRLQSLGPESGISLRKVCTVSAPHTAISFTRGPGTISEPRESPQRGSPIIKFSGLENRDIFSGWLFS